jgi:hypothetical protein
MFKGEIRKAYEAQKIDRVVVARLFSRPGQKEPWASPHGYVREGKNYRYLLLFIPNKKEVPTASPNDYFIFLNRKDKQFEIRWYKSLFTASQDIAEWGFESYEIFDLTGHTDLGDAFNRLRKDLTDRKISIKPVRRFMDDLVNIERGLPMRTSPELTRFYL